MPHTPAHLSGDDIRRIFIEFFKSKPSAGDGHTFVASSPCVPHDDPTLLFTNAGMNQFKPIFLGTADPASELGKLKRAVNSQKCIRAGGKHNDLDDVGKDTYHHTFFEMLGNWSFGDYFKKEAIAWSFELLTKVYGIAPDRLYATYFGGNLEVGLEPDEETKQLWLQLLPAKHVLPGNMKDNFWEMGETGPCGPCTEIHFDRIGNRDASKLVNTGDPDVLEIWNNVFIQFNREEGGKLRMLPAKHVDTGMGLERLVSVLQNKRSNYDTDVFMPLFAAIQKATGFTKPYSGKLGAEDVGNVDTAYRVIADHIRTLTFAITDGATPSNEGRGYVLRRILRRAVRYGRQVMDAKPGFFASLVPAVVERMGGAFPELKKAPQRVIDMLREEEESFGRTLDRGIHLFQHAASRAFSRVVVANKHLLEQESPTKSPGQSGASITFIIGHPTNRLTGELEEVTFDPDAKVRLKQGKSIVYEGPGRSFDGSLTAKLGWPAPVISASDSFQLYDTFGFPIDLTQQMAEERGLKVDIEGYERLMEEAKQRSRLGGKEDGAKDLSLDADAVARLRSMNIEPTDDSDKFHSRDVGTSVKAIWNGDNFDQHTGTHGSAVNAIGLVFDRTNFYATMGGQEHDTGRVFVTSESRSGRDTHQGGAGGEFRVEKVLAFGGYVLHIGRMIRGEVRVGDRVQLMVDDNRRKPIASNHTATHLLNFALRRVVGDHVDQKGSHVAPDRFRFDFANNGPVTPEQARQAEAIVRDLIKKDLTVYADLAPQFVARSIAGLRAVFGEAYPDPVRVVSIGQPVADLLASPENPAWKEVSIEFCGGTHVASTMHLVDFAITSEEAVAKGVRRMVALTGVAASAAIKAADTIAERVRTAANVPVARLAAEVVEIGRDIDQMTIPLGRKDELRTAVAALQERVKAAQKEASAAKRSEAAGLARQIAQSAATSGDDIIISTIDVGGDRGALEQAVKTIRDICPKAAVMLLSTDTADPAAPKVSAMAGVPPELVQKGLNAGEWVREAATVLGGKGGGRPDSAQGGGTNVAKIKDAIAAARQFAMRKLH
ncbi:MAG: alanine--tRNA ligase [Phycisphaerales bacterium]